MGRVLPDPIRNRVRYGLKKNPKWVQVGFGFYQKTRDPTQDLAQLETQHLKLQKYPVYIYIFLYSNPNPSFLHSSAADTHTPSVLTPHLNSAALILA